MPTDFFGLSGFAALVAPTDAPADPAGISGFEALAVPLAIVAFIVTGLGYAAKEWRAGRQAKVAEAERDRDAAEKDRDTRIAEVIADRERRVTAAIADAERRVSAAQADTERSNARLADVNQRLDTLQTTLDEQKQVAVDRYEELYDRLARARRRLQDEGVPLEELP